MSNTKPGGYTLIIIGSICLSVMITMILTRSSPSMIFTILSMLLSLTIVNLGISLTQFHKTIKRRRKAVLVLLIVSLSLILIGGLFIYMKWVSARIQIIIGVNILCFAAGPLLVKNRFDKWKHYTTNHLQAFGLSIADLLSLVLLSMGALFKLQFWPGAKPMLILGIIFLITAALLWKDVLKRIIYRQKLTEEDLIRKNEQIEEAHKEILDSINYAKRIQTAILPPDRIVKEYLQNSFILYKPKDVVAGDFYWMESVDDTIFFAAADCTGHGVPGAMVSVICNNGLNRSVREFGLRDPGEILDKTRELVIQEFEKSEEEVKDGMDISLCALGPIVSSSRGTYRELRWAGANNPLWIVRKGAEEMEEIKADKQPIGKYHHETPFTTHKIKLNKGDTIYIFSDGYPDQFGGDNGKKYKSGNFKRRLLELAQQPIEKQKDILDQEFENWRGELEQIDDVCVIGVRV